MTRLQRFVRSVASGYLLLATNVIYTLVSVRLALRAFGKEEYGVWATVAQIGIFLSLVEFGMTTAISRHLIDHKDDRDSGAFGRMLKTTLLTLFIQAGLVAVMGGALTFVAGRWIDVPPEHLRTFHILMLGQVGVIALAFPVRIFSIVLVVHQRSDSVSLSQMAQMLVQLLVFWLLVRSGKGIISLLWASYAGFAASTAVVAWLGLRTEYFPGRGKWGKVCWKEFRQVFAFAGSMFLISIGLQILIASQTILVAQGMGLAAATDWNVNTRTFLLVSSVIWRTFDLAFPAFSEMVVRGERQLLLKRLHGLLRLVLVLAAIACVGIATVNEWFVSVWVGSMAVWENVNNLLLGLWLLPLTLSRCLVVLLQTTKNVQKIPQVLVIEGLTFIVLGIVLSQYLRFAGFLVASIVCSSLISMSYGIRVTRRYFEMPLGEAVRQWIRPVGVMLILVGLPAVAVAFGTAGLPPWGGLTVNALFVLGWGGAMAWFFGLSSELRGELLSRVRGKLRRSPRE